MERKGGSTTVVAEEIRAAVAKKSRALTSEEEKTLRMRHGVAGGLEAPLPSAAGANAELADELLLMEMQLLRSYRAKGLARPQPVPRTVGAPRNLAKDKIVRALRKKR